MTIPLMMLMAEVDIMFHVKLDLTGYWNFIMWCTFIYNSSSKTDSKHSELHRLILICRVCVRLSTRGTMEGRATGTGKTSGSCWTDTCSS